MNAACLIGITGNSGCGQSTAAGFLAGYSSGICSLDATGHRMLTKPYVLKELAAGLLRNDILTMSENRIRRELGRVVFDDPQKLAILNSILHPRMIRWACVSSAVLRSSSGIWILEGALIYELGIDRYLDRIIVIEDTPWRSAERLALRDDISPEYALKRWRRQLPMDEKIKRADHVVHNSKSKDYLRQQILNIFEELEDRQLT